MSKKVNVGPKSVFHFWWVPLVVTFLIWAILPAPKPVIKSAATTERPLRKHYPESTQEQKLWAFDYAKRFINPVLSRHASDPKELPAISNRIWDFSRRNQSGKLGYAPSPVRNPWDHSAVAKVNYDDERKQNEVVVFIPLIEADKAKYDKSGRPQDFEDYLVLTFAHEVIHLELLERNPVYEEGNRLGWSNRVLMAQNEAEAWGITILEVARPLLSLNRHVPEAMAIRSTQLEKVGDNYKDPRWVAFFYTP